MTELGEMQPDPRPMFDLIEKEGRRHREQMINSRLKREGEPDPTLISDPLMDQIERLYSSKFFNKLISGMHGRPYIEVFCERLLKRLKMKNAYRSLRSTEGSFAVDRTSSSIDIWTVPHENYDRGGKSTTYEIISLEKGKPVRIRVYEMPNATERIIV